MSRRNQSDYLGKLATNAGNTFLTGFGLCVGSLMILLGHLLGDQCKIQAIDSSSMANQDVRGNLPKWFIYTGAIYLVGSSLGCGVVGIVPLTLRAMCKSFGGALADVLSGFCGRIVLFLVYMVLLADNLIGAVWLYLAGINRSDRNSSAPGDPNYCVPTLWYSAHIITKGFWVFTVIIILRLIVSCHKISQPEAYKEAKMKREPKDGEP